VGICGEVSFGGGLDLLPQALTSRGKVALVLNGNMYAVPRLGREYSGICKLAFIYNRIYVLTHRAFNPSFVEEP
jgi:hypothetical protein